MISNYNSYASDIALLGDSIPLLEVDDEEIEQRQNDSMQNYWFNLVLESIGTPFFESRYTMIKNKFDTTELDFGSKVRFCELLRDRLVRYCGFYNLSHLHFYTNEEVDDFLDLVEFIEFNNVDLVNKLKKRLSKLDLVLERELSKLPRLISEFLRTLSLEMLVKWLNKSVELHSKIIHVEE